MKRLIGNILYGLILLACLPAYAVAALLMPIADRLTGQGPNKHEGR